ncbi:MAG: sigma-70 family RNA polymerase sigma factor [Planctomycetota bacterium]
MNEPSDPRFHTTNWSLVVAAGKDGSEEADRALENLCQAYWYPLYAFARRSGRSIHEAEDLTQGFLSKVLERGYLKSADRERGRFRSFLLTMFKRFASAQHQAAEAQRRGGGVRHLPLDFDDGERRYSLEPVDGWTAEKHFERQWALTMLARVMDKLRGNFSRRDMSDLFEKLQVYLTAQAGEANYDDLSRETGLSAGALRVRVHRMRAEYRDLLHAEVTETLEDPKQAEQELEYLRTAIRGSS